jgi:cation:H+ antiporter
MISLTLPFIFLILSIIILYIGGEIIIRTSVLIAEYLRVPTLIIGLTVVSFATSLPEVFVSVEALLEGSSNIALGNVFGSNIANLSLVMAVLALLSNLNITKQTFTIDYPFLLIISLFLGFIMLSFYFINLYFGILFLIILFFYLVYITKSRSDNEYLEINQSKDIVNNKSQFKLIKNIILLLLVVFVLKL